jgi:hypothetical protein
MAQPRAQTPWYSKVADKVSLGRYCNSNVPNTKVLISSCLGFSSMEGDRSYCTVMITVLLPHLYLVFNKPNEYRAQVGDVLKSAKVAADLGLRIHTSTGHLAIYRSSCVEVVEPKRRYPFNHLVSSLTVRHTIENSIHSKGTGGAEMPLRSEFEKGHVEQCRGPIINPPRGVLEPEPEVGPSLPFPVGLFGKMTSWLRDGG